MQDELPESLANSSNTIAWWQSRQAEVQARLSERRKAVGRTISEASDALCCRGRACGGACLAPPLQPAAATSRLLLADGCLVVVPRCPLPSQATSNGKAAVSKIKLLELVNAVRK